MGYPGGKSFSGGYQTIINQMPPHDVYVEAFAGGGAILLHKREAEYSIAIDADAVPLATLAGCVPILECIHGDALTWLLARQWTGRELVYADPPYLMEARSSQRPIYTHEFGTREEHAVLLAILTELPCMVAISGYVSSLYEAMLQGPRWRAIQYTGLTRQGPAEEWLWMNYPVPTALHDYRYLGSDFRERERIGRKKRRWTERLRGMPALERYALLAALEEVGASS